MVKVLTDKQWSLAREAITILIRHNRDMGTPDDECIVGSLTKLLKELKPRKSAYERLNDDDRQRIDDHWYSMYQHDYEGLMIEVLKRSTHDEIHGVLEEYARRDRELGE